ncbi:MAG: CoA transferase [Dehalococcoidales bacterium]|nr:CoA transferase [Dehalococcoidales bacterium]
MLDDVRIVEYGESISAPYCSKLLADLGAEVIKIERPVSGDVMRRRGPFLDDIQGPDRSGVFLYLNSNKYGVTLDIEKPTGRDILRKLLKDADVFIEDTRPGTLDTLGIGAKDLKALHPALIVTSVSPFGQNGPYKKYRGADLISWHMGGPGYVTPHWIGTAKQEPLKAMQTASFVAGISAAIAVMTALNARDKTHRGQQVDVSQLESTITMFGYCLAYWPYEHRSDTRVSKPAIAPENFIQCKDGWVCMRVVEEHHWKTFVEAIGNPDWASHGLFDNMYQRAEHWESLQPLLTSWAMEHTKKEIFDLAKRVSIPIGPLYSMEEVVSNPQLTERDYFVEIMHPEVGKLTYPGAPYKLNNNPWQMRLPAPKLGQHNVDIYGGRLGYTKEELVKLYECGII